MQKFWTNLKNFMGGACHRFPHKVVQGVKYMHTAAKSFIRSLALLLHLNHLINQPKLIFRPHLRIFKRTVLELKEVRII